MWRWGVNRAVLVEGLTELFPEFGYLQLMYLLDGGFERGHAEVHGGAWG
jgi:hypothetical protein